MSMFSLISRRTFLSGAASVLGVMAMPGASFAITKGDAQQLVEQVVNRINAVIASGKSEAAMIRDFEDIFSRYADTSYIAAYAMGVDGRRATTAQKKAFSDAFKGYLARKYGKRFREFIGGRVEIVGAKTVKNYVEVGTKTHLQGRAPFDVTYHVSDRTGKNLFFNMYVEGINMLLTERSEVGAMLDHRRGDIDAMISDLRRAG